MTMSGQSYTERAEIDPMLTPEYIEAVRLAYAAGRDYRSNDLSPLFADFTRLPRRRSSRSATTRSCIRIQNNSIRR